MSNSTYQYIERHGCNHSKCHERFDVTKEINP